MWRGPWVQKWEGAARNLFSVWNLYKQLSLHLAPKYCWTLSVPSTNCELQGTHNVQGGYCLYDPSNVLHNIHLGNNSLDIAWFWLGYIQSCDGFRPVVCERKDLMDYNLLYTCKSCNIFLVGREVNLFCNPLIAKMNISMCIFFTVLTYSICYI